MKPEIEVIVRRSAAVLHNCIAVLGIIGTLEEMIHIAGNPEYKGSLRRCLQEIREESKRSDFVGFDNSLQTRVRSTREQSRGDQSMSAEATAVRVSGKVKMYKVENGYGFVGVDGRKDVFVHRSALPRGVENLDVGQEITFEIIEAPKGPQATNVQLT